MTSKSIGHDALAALEMGNQKNAGKLFIECANAMLRDDASQGANADALSLMGISLLRKTSACSDYSELRERLEALEREYDEAFRKLDERTTATIESFNELKEITYVGSISRTRAFTRSGGKEDAVRKFGWQVERLNNSGLNDEWRALFELAEQLLTYYEGWLPESQASGYEKRLSRSGYIKEGKYTRYVNLMLMSDGLRVSIEEAADLIEQCENFVEQLSELRGRLARAEMEKNTVLANAKAVVERL